VTRRRSSSRSASSVDAATQGRPKFHAIDIEISTTVRVARIILLIAIVVGCATKTAIPSGAQTVNVVGTENAVRLDPTTVRAGDLYLVLDVPQRGVELVYRGGSNAREPLTADDLAHLSQDVDAEGLALESLSASCCGNVFKVSLPPGRYAFILRDPASGVGRPPASFAVLEVSP
jgi:hypothetical protein